MHQILHHSETMIETTTLVGIDSEINPETTASDIGGAKRIDFATITTTGFLPFFGGGFPYENRLQRKVGTLILSSLLKKLEADLLSFYFPRFGTQVSSWPQKVDRFLLGP